IRTSNVWHIFCLLSHRNSEQHYRTIVIDGLNRADLLSNIKKCDPSCPIIVVWREGESKLPKIFIREMSKINRQIKLLLGTPTLKQIDDICAMIIALHTNGRLYTNDMIRNHFNLFEAFYKCLSFKSFLRIYFVREEGEDFWKFRLKIDGEINRVSAGVNQK
ncbi:hypothetical protein PENTCL1PPCAC_21853, partial [Pristionchus entomophagus]